MNDRIEQNTEDAGWQDLSADELAATNDWFVETNDAYIGPIGIGDLEQRWRSQQITEETLVWNEGMADWRPLADVSELTYLITDFPKAPQAQAREDQIVWKTSESLSLDVLVQQEMEALTAAPASQGEQEAEPPLGLPQLEALGFTDGGSRRPFSTGPSTAGFFTAATAPLPPKMSPWMVWVFLALAVAAFLLFAVGTAMPLAIEWIQSPPLSRLHQEASKTSPAPVLAGAGAANSEMALPPLGSPVAPVPLVPATAPSVPVAPVMPVVKTPAATSTRRLIRAPKPAVERVPKEPRRIAKPQVTGVSPESSEPAAASETAKPRQQLSRRQIVEQVRNNVHTLKPCIRGARSRGELVSGRHKLVLEWTIRESGETEGAKLKGPVHLAGTSLAACIALKMDGWNFPATDVVTPVGNFPLPVRVP